MLQLNNAEFSFIAVWFTDLNNRLLEIEDNVNITLIIFCHVLETLQKNMVKKLMDNPTKQE